MELWIAFITGLTTGGLSCLAVQGGLLASSIAHEVELSVAAGTKKKRGQPPVASTGRPIILFLVAKLAAYTLLGGLLGWLGSVLQLSPLFRAVLQLTIGVFMIGTALRMLNVHPIFRNFVIEPPSAVTRYIRRTAKAGDNTVTPLFLGALTVLIPCGVTQAMMAVAMGSGSPMQGAAIMFAFILGTSPVFFAVAYLATRLGAKLESNFMRLVAVVVLALGFVSVDASLTLMGSPYSVSNLVRSFTRPASAQQDTALASPLAGALPTRAVFIPPQLTGLAAPAQGPATASTGSAEPAVLTINVVNSGYQPASLEAPANQPLQLALVTKNTYSCSRAFVIPSLNMEKLLPKTGTEVLNLPPQPAGSVLYFSCSMGMYGGQIAFK
jgi:uncharacterized protein